MSLSPPLVPKDGRQIRILLICRVSSPGNGKQDIRSLDDQEQMLRRWVAEHIGTNVEIVVIAGQGSGERLDREELHQAEAAVESGKFDLVLTEDLGRILRRARAIDFCEIAEDCGTRVIAINDNVDTLQKRWRANASFASMRHEMSNEDTSDRIRRTQDNRFANGGLLRPPIYGYIKPPGAKHEDDLQRDPAAVLIYQHCFDLLESGASFSEVADYLNENEVPTGPSARSKRWTCKMVARVFRNPILKGIRRRHERISRRKNSTGRYMSQKAPPEALVERFVPHLVMIEPARWDRVNRLLAERNARHRRGRKSGVDPRAAVPRKRTQWPGQHLQCGVCGNIYVYQGTKPMADMMCSGATRYECWNTAAVNGPLAARLISEAILAELDRLPGFEESLIEALQQEIDTFDWPCRTTPSKQA
ncbi:MAG: recombinase family protein [Pirellulales bacterium]